MAILQQRNLILVLVTLNIMIQHNLSVSEADFTDEILVESEPYDPGEVNCPSPGDRKLPFAAENVGWAEPFRAYKTLPPGLFVMKSSIPNAGYGVISEIFIKKYTWLGEYEGEYVSLERADGTSWYTWMSHRGGEISHYIDGNNIDTSNALRFINCARHQGEMNVDINECKGKVYYMTIRDIAPGQELLMYYGDAYAKVLGIEPFYDAE